MMAEARGRAMWAHTSSILALIANVNRDPKKRGPFTAADFDPYAKAERDRAIPVGDWKSLKAVFEELKP